MKKSSFILFAAAFALTACNNKASAPIISAADASQRTYYFASHGWEVKEISEKDITIPSQFSDAYEEYVRLQDKQELPLRGYKGMKAQRFEYEVKNYSPDNMKMLAELIVCGNTVIASMIYSEDGESLRMPVS